MANKPFEIQGADLTLGGVNIQAGTTGVVIPGITQAASYRVEEVEDTGDQTTTFQSVPTIIDAVTFDDYVINQASIGRATYTCDLDDDGYIDDIEVTSTGLYLNTLAEADPLLAYTGSAPDPFDPFVQGDWTAIPFRPKTRAEGVETIGGSGSVVERSVTFPEGASGDTRGTIALTPDGTTYICTEDWADASIGLQGTFTAVTTELYNVAQSGGSFNSAVLSIADEPELYNIVRYGNWTEGQFTVNAGVDYGGAQNVVSTNWNDQDDRIYLSWLHREEDPSELAQGSSVTFVYTGSGTQPPIWKQLINLSQGGEGDGEISWRSDGDLTIETLRPAGYTGDCDLNLYAADDIFIEARGDDVGISAFNVVRINTDDGGHTWTFDQTGNLTIPGNILKTTEASIVVGELLVNVEVQTVDELVPPGGVWRLFINDSSYPTLGNTVQIGETVTTSWGTPITATIVDIQQGAGNWQIHVNQDITAGFNSYDTVTFSSVPKTWTLGTDGTLTLPAGGDILDSNGDSVLSAGGNLIGNGSASSSGFSVVFYTDYQGYQSNGPTNTSVSIASYNGLAIGDIITFRGGEVRTITAIDLDTPVVNVTQLTWEVDVENSYDNPMFPITITSSDYTAEVKPTARIKPNADYVALGQYMEIYTGGAPSTMDDLGHIHMKGHSGNVELFLGTDDNFVSTKEAGTTPGHVTMRSETDVKVIETDIRTRRNGSTFISDLGDGYNYHWVHNGQSGDIAHNTVAVDSQGNYYVGGEHTNYAEGMVSKFSKDGSLLWSKLIGGETSNYAWDVPVIAVNPTTDKATALYITNLDRAHNYFKMAELDADGNIDGTVTDFYDVDGNVRPRDMKWHPSLGWVIVGQTYGDALASASLSPQTGSGVGRLVLGAAATDLRGALMTTGDTSWYLGGDNISGKQLLDTGIGLYRSLSVVNVTVTNPAAAGAGINVRINYAGNAYFGIDGIATPGSNYTTGDTVKVLGTDLGGLSPENDVTFIIVDNGSGGIAGSSSASGTPNISTISLDMAQLGYTTADFSTGSYIVYKQVSGRPFVWTNTWKKFLNVEEGYDYGYATAVDFSSDGEDIFVAGYTDGSRNALAGGGFLWALTDAGATSWVKGLDNLWEIRSIAVSEGGAVYAFSSGMGTDITMFSGANGAVLNRIQLNAAMGGRGHIDTAVDEAGNECLYVVWSEYSSPFTATNNGMAVQKFTLLLDLVWSRHMYLSNGLSLYSDYDSNYKHFALTPTQAAVVGYGLILDDGYDDGQLWTLSITDDFEPTDQVGDVNGIVTGVVDLPWSIASDEYIPLDLTAVLLPQTSGLQVQTITSTFTWNTLTWQNRILNGNFETKGLADIEKVNFVQGDNLGHNPVDVPLSTQNLQVDDPINWNITLRMTDRGKFIKNRATPAVGNIQDLKVYVPKSSDVPFPIGTVITLINLDTSGTYYIYVEGSGWSIGDSDRPIIWAAGETVESTWSFTGVQTATLMKIGNNDWLLTANNVIDASL